MNKKLIIVLGAIASLILLSSNKPKKRYSCKICNNIVKTAERLGDRNFGEKLMNEAYNGMPTSEVMKRFEKRFGKAKFRAEYDKILKS